MNSNCSALRGVDCEHHGRRNLKSVDLQHWLSEKSHQRSFLEETWSRTAIFGRLSDLARRSAPDLSKRCETHGSFKMLQVHPSGQVANASIKLEMLLFEFFSPEERRSSSPIRPETMHGWSKRWSVRPAVRPGEGNSPTIKPYREYVPLVSVLNMCYWPVSVYQPCTDCVSLSCLIIVSQSLADFSLQVAVLRLVSSHTARPFDAQKVPRDPFKSSLNAIEKFFQVYMRVFVALINGNCLSVYLVHTGTCRLATAC